MVLDEKAGLQRLIIKAINELKRAGRQRKFSTSGMLDPVDLFHRSPKDTYEGRQDATNMQDSIYSLKTAGAISIAGLFALKASGSHSAEKRCLKTS